MHVLIKFNFLKGGQLDLLDPSSMRLPFGSEIQNQKTSTSAGSTATSAVQEAMAHFSQNVDGKYFTYRRKFRTKETTLQTRQFSV